MNESSSQGVFNQTGNANHSPATDEEALSELWSILNSQTQGKASGAANVAQGTSAPAAALQQPQSCAEEEAIAELRNLLLGSQSSQKPSSEEEAIAELRNLLLGPELQARLDSLQLRVEDVSQVLPEAIILRTMQDEQLTKAVMPTVEQALEVSVKQDLNVLANSLFPIFGPATRKAVAAAMKTLTESLNQTLDHSLSPQGFKWRLEALQTGKSFAEVVLLRTLVYRVEQVFLIHRETGLVLQHAVAPTVAAQDADLVSAMLKAIQDFVQDSFSVSQEDALETLHFGELTIWIDQGPQAILAGVIRGTPPQELRLSFQTTLEQIHKQFRSSFISFQGDNTHFEPSKQYLEACLQTQHQPKKDKPSPILFALLGIILCSIGLWGFFSFQERQRWVSYLEKLNSQPGIVVVDAEKRWGKYFISGLRDPLAIDPVKLMRSSKLNPQTVTSNWESYLSFEPRFIIKRAKQLLQPPETVSLSIDENGILHATGSAQRQWIDQARNLAPNIPGITQFRSEQLIEAELQALHWGKKIIENQIIYFVTGYTQIVPGQSDKIQTVVREIKKLTDAAASLNKGVRIEIIGHSDSDGLEENNLLVSQARAELILSNLVSQGLTKTHLTAKGVGSREPWQNASAQKQENKEFNRRVSFRVFLMDTL